MIGGTYGLMELVEAYSGAFVGVEVVERNKDNGFAERFKVLFAENDKVLADNCIEYVKQQIPDADVMVVPTFDMSMASKFIVCDGGAVALGYVYEPEDVARFFRGYYGID